METEREVQFTVGEAAFITSLSPAEVQKAVDEEWFAFAQRRVIRGLTYRSFGPADLVHLRLVKDIGDCAILHTEAKKQIHRRLRERLPDVVIARGDHLVFVEAKRSSRFSPQSLMQQFDRQPAQPDVPEQPSADAMAPQVRTVTLPDEAVVRFILTHPDSDHLAGLRLWANTVTKRLEEPIRISLLSLDVAAAWGEIVDRTAEMILAQWVVVSDPDIRGGEPVVRGTRIPAHLLRELKQQGATTGELLADYPALDERSLESALLYAETHPRRGRPRKGPWHDSAAR